MRLQTAGSLPLAAGLVTRLAALLLCAERVGSGAALGSTWPWLDRGIEYPVLPGLLALAFAWYGGGAAFGGCAIAMGARFV